MDRKDNARKVRVAAADLAASRPHPTHVSNKEESKLLAHGRSEPSLIANFTKCLPHSRPSGLLADPDHYKLFVKGVDTGDVHHIKKIPLGPQGVSHEERFKSTIAKAARDGKGADVRAWESMAAGLTYDLEGPDAQAVTMPPAPKLDSEELVAEMTELYYMALLRDTPFSSYESDDLVAKAVHAMNKTQWMKGLPADELTNAEKGRLRAKFTPKSIFRGTFKGDNTGPYISQFLICGTEGLAKAQDVSEGLVQYGGMRMDQRVRYAKPGKDYMTTWEAWFDVQNGADLRDMESYEQVPKFAFIHTPRQLSVYVHYDALYQAYLNAAIILLDIKSPFDKGLPFQDDDDIDKQQAFATFGGPTILSLVTEVATRALKAVRFQKYNVHRRMRPEVCAARIDRYRNNDDDPNVAPADNLVNAIGEDLLKKVAAHNRKQNEDEDRKDDDRNGHRESYLLPMAFAEGSPCHPCYGAGHACVAGACVTILKAYFDCNATLPFAFQSSPDGQSLSEVKGLKNTLTVEGELNKLCANISVGRNWAGVHYFSDYIESARMGEQIAIGVLEEQALTYGEKFSMKVPLFDGGEKVIKN